MGVLNRLRALALLCAAVAMLMPLANAQSGSTGTFGDAVVFEQETSAAAFIMTTDGVAIRNKSQASHVLVVEAPSAVATVTGIQVRIEAQFINSGPWIPISEDITTVEDVSGSGDFYAAIRANGTVPAVRVRNVTNTGAEPLRVTYIGNPFPIGIISVSNGRIIIGSTAGAFAVRAILCNATPCATGLNVVNEWVAWDQGTIDYCDAYAKTGPTGADLVIDFNLNGSSIFGATKLVIPDGGNRPVSPQQNFNTGSLPAVNLRDRITIDIDQIGSGDAGQDVFAVCRISR